MMFDNLNKEDITTSIFCKKCGKELETGGLYTKYNSKTGEPIQGIIIVRCPDFACWSGGCDNGHFYKQKFIRIKGGEHDTE